MVMTFPSTSADKAQTAKRAPRGETLPVSVSLRPGVSYLETRGVRPPTARNEDSSLCATYRPRLPHLFQTSWWHDTVLSNVTPGVSPVSIMGHSYRHVWFRGGPMPSRTAGTTEGWPASFVRTASVSSHDPRQRTLPDSRLLLREIRTSSCSNDHSCRYRIPTHRSPSALRVSS